MQLGCAHAHATWALSCQDDVMSWQLAFLTGAGRFPLPCALPMPNFGCVQETAFCSDVKQTLAEQSYIHLLPGKMASSSHLLPEKMASSSRNGPHESSRIKPHITLVSLWNDLQFRVLGEARNNAWSTNCAHAGVHGHFQLRKPFSLAICAPLNVP